MSLMQKTMGGEKNANLCLGCNRLTVPNFKRKQPPVWRELNKMREACGRRPEPARGTSTAVILIATGIAPESTKQINDLQIQQPQGGRHDF
jgi:hypothetical protein